MDVCWAASSTSCDKPSPSPPRVDLQAAHFEMRRAFGASQKAGVSALV